MKSKRSVAASNDQEVETLSGGEHSSGDTTHRISENVSRSQSFNKRQAIFIMNERPSESVFENHDENPSIHEQFQMPMDDDTTAIISSQRLPTTSEPQQFGPTETLVLNQQSVIN
jgi:hypothetical protein